MSDPSALVEEQPRRPVNMVPFGIGAALLLVFFALGSAIGGELGQFMIASLNALPFAVLAVLAYLGAGRPNWAWVATGLWLLLMIAGLSLTIHTLSLSVLAGGALTPEAGVNLDRGDWTQLALIFLGTTVCVLLGASLLIPAVRRLVARVIPIDPNSFVQSVALIAVVTLALLCFIPLLVLGEPPFLALVDELSGQVASRGQVGQYLDMIYGLIWTIPCTILAVGYGIRRDLRQSLQRLGLVRPTLRQAGAAVGIALLLVAAVQVIGLATDWLWGVFGWQTTNDEAFGELIGFAINPLGALLIGVTAGLGEELAVRGVLQPRLGILLSDFFFTSLHALQYSWDALLIVFVVGAACGIVRQRTNTSTAAIVHGAYNFTLVMLAAAGLGT